MILNLLGLGYSFREQFTRTTGVAMDYFGDFTSTSLLTQQVCLACHGNHQVDLIRGID